MAGAEPISIGELLRRYRIRAGLTQEELAERAGLSARAIRALETSASRAPRKDTLALLVSALGLTTAERDLLERTMRQRRIPAQPSARPAGSIRRTHTPLVGRQRERTLLDAFLRGEGPPLLLLAGEPGIGKSRLLERAAEQAEELGWTVLAGGCNRRSAQDPYAPCVEALARLVATRGPAQLRMDLQGCGWLVRLLPELADHTVSPAQSWALPPQQERRLMFAAAARFLENVAGPAGTLLILDDLHWAGVDALDLLAFLLREAPAGNLRIVGAYRDTDVSAHDSLPAVVSDLVRAGLAASVPLAPLAGDEATQLLNLLLADVPLDTSTVKHDIVSRAGGIPFYLVSCAQEARLGVPAGLAKLAEPLAVPRNAAESIRQRVAQLAKPAQTVLSVVAVAERQMRHDILLPVVEGLGHSEGATLDALEATIRARLLGEHADGSYAFTHDLIRETVEGDLSGARRAALHRRVAEAIERLPQEEQQAAELAWHFARGDELARALPYALRAGDHAEAIYAHSEAELHFAAAGEWARRLGERKRLGEALEKRADVLFRLARFPEAYTCLEEAIRIYRADGNWERLAWSTAQVAKVSDSLGWTESSLMRLEELFRMLAAAADGSDTSGKSPAGGEDSLERQAASATSLLTPRTAARVYLCLTSRLLFLHRFEEVYEPSERAIQYAWASDNLPIESLAYAFRAGAQQARGQLTESAASVARARVCAVESGDLEALYIALGAEAVIHEMQAEPRRARETLLSMLETATQLGDVSYIIETLNSLALVTFALGEWDVSAGYFTRSATLLQGAEADRWRWPAGGPAVLNAVRSKQGLPLSVTLVGYFTRSATLLQGTGSDSQHLPAIGLAVLGALRAEQDSFPLVAQDGALVDVEDTIYTRTGVWAIATLAELDILAGRAEAAAARLRRAIERFEKMPTSAISLFAPLAWAELECGDQARAREALAQARQLAGEQRNQMALADIERITAIQALRKRRWAETRRALDQSLAICQEGAYPYAEAKARYVYGQLDSATGRQAAARGQYEQALAICERLGERCYRSHIERALMS